MPFMSLQHSTSVMHKNSSLGSYRLHGTQLCSESQRSKHLSLGNNLIGGMGLSALRHWPLSVLRAELLEARETIASNRETIDSLRAQLADAEKTREGRCRTSSPEP